MRFHCRRTEKPPIFLGASENTHEQRLPRPQAGGMGAGPKILQLGVQAVITGFIAVAGAFFI